MSEHSWPQHHNFLPLPDKMKITKYIYMVYNKMLICYNSLDPLVEQHSPPSNK